MPRLESHMVVVTGASRGLGRALAVGLAREGARMVLVARDAKALSETADRIAAAGSAPLVIAADVSRADDVARVQQTVLAERPPTALINNAGQFLAGPLENLSASEVAGLFGAVVVGSVLMTQAFLPALRKAAHGVVLNIGARVAAPGFPLDTRGTSIPYQTAKRHLTTFAASLRQECPDLDVATLYLPTIGSMADLDDGPEVLARLYPGLRVVPLATVVGVVANRLSGVLPRWDDCVLAPA